MALDFLRSWPFLVGRVLLRGVTSLVVANGRARHSLGGRLGMDPPRRRGLIRCPAAHGVLANESRRPHALGPAAEVILFVLTLTSLVGRCFGHHSSPSEMGTPIHRSIVV